MADELDPLPEPRVMAPRSGSQAARVPPADEVYSFWGYTPHFEIYLARSLGSVGVLVAEAVKERCEDDYERLRRYFGLTPDDLPFRVYITSGGDGASHSSCGDTTMYCGADGGGNLSLVPYLVASEADEVFMDSQGRGWLCDWSNGEGLSRALAADAYPPGMPGYNTAVNWLDSHRPDWVSTNYGSDRHWESLGCSALFLHYLRVQLGFGWSLIAQVGARWAGWPSPSLASTYGLLTGRTDAFDSFSSLISRRFPAGVSDLDTDNPFPLRPDLVFYARSGGIGQLYATNMSGDIALLSTYTNWRTTWTQIVPMHFSRARHSDLLFYNAHDGLGELYSTNGLGELNPIARRYTNWRTTWSIIVAGCFTGGQFSDLLFYDAAGGIGEFYRTDQHGGITLVNRHDDWLTTWAAIVAGHFSRSDLSDLLFYEPNAGVLECWTVDAYGNVAFLSSNPTSHTWSIIVPLNVTGSPFSDLLCYDPANGIGELLSSDGQGRLRHVRSFTGWRTNWSAILSPSFGQLLFYSAESGVAQFYAMDPRGLMTLQRTHEDWRTGWSVIRTGNFVDHV